MTGLTFDRTFDATPGQAQRLSPLVRRVLADNPSPYTFKGTNSFIVGNGQVAVIDPGPDDDAQFAALLDAVKGETVTHILVTHSHADHSPLARRLKHATGAVMLAYGAVDAPLASGLRLDASIDHDFVPDMRLAEGDEVNGPGWTLEALFTPGHMSNHMCFALKEEQALFAGDHVMAWATSVIAPPDGDMGQYFASLRKLLDRDDQVYHPGHGPSKRDPLPLVRGYLAHRRMREEAIRARIEQGARSVSEIVASIYAGVDPKLHGAAALSTTAHLDHLVQQGKLRKVEGVYESV
ncbi:MAG: MBL fold metallo-hydrolase [Aestuariivirga sp.]|uniref:MBL fold metallo-hydrolase n=1 Tax=Aestuariivirga sp. TaxID=2650926 RepID=UPI0025BC1B9C|nr:MBL fold metallo-hydrolase [Aestuariivirga sp.]MCA3560821.1 MBL fold metallo-hydrolase [Aestuariivirga sp.]